MERLTFQESSKFDHFFYDHDLLQAITKMYIKYSIIKRIDHTHSMSMIIV